MTADEEARAAAELRLAGLQWRPGSGDRPGDPACLLPRVCQACGAVAESDPPTTCPQCGIEIPGA
jgi:predicted Zn-ribbon and HTH transcriptional regulator